VAQSTALCQGKNLASSQADDEQGRLFIRKPLHLDPMVLLLQLSCPHVVLALCAHACSCAMLLRRLPWTHVLVGWPLRLDPCLWGLPS
jgi:hypothetical protein